MLFTDSFPFSTDRVTSCTGMFEKLHKTLDAAILSGLFMSLQVSFGDDLFSTLSSSFSLSNYNFFSVPFVSSHQYHVFVRLQSLSSV